MTVKAGYRSCRHSIAVTVSAICTAMAPGGPAQARDMPDDDFGPPPEQAQYASAVDRSASRLFRARLESVAWREPRRGWLQGYAGYITCGQVRLRQRDEPLTVAAIWRRGDVSQLLVDWNFDESDPFASRWDLPIAWVVAVPDLPTLCARYYGEAAQDFTPGETFDWAPQTAWEGPWRTIRTTRRSWTEGDRDDVGRLSECLRLETRTGRRYRVSVNAPLDTSVSILSDRACAGHALGWNRDRSATDRNPQVEFEGAGTVFAYVLADPGGAPGPYTLVIEEAAPSPSLRPPQPCGPRAPACRPPRPRPD